MAKIHIHHHFDGKILPTVPDLRHSRVLRHAPEICGLDHPAQLKFIQAKLQETPGGLFVGSRVYISGAPVRPHAGLPLTRQVGDDFGGKMREYQMGRLARVLGIPLIPTEAPYTYYARSEWVAEKMLRVIGLGERMDLIAKAAVLENIFIF